jgi:hypothetical protein
MVMLDGCGVWNVGLGMEIRKEIWKKFEMLDLTCVGTQMEILHWQ